MGKLECRLAIIEQTNLKSVSQTLIRVMQSTLKGFTVSVSVRSRMLFIVTKRDKM